jgi:hypothetical protein
MAYLSLAVGPYSFTLPGICLLFQKLEMNVNNSTPAELLNVPAEQVMQVEDPATGKLIYQREDQLLIFDTYIWLILDTHI